MTSRLIQTLRAKIANTTDGFEWARLMSRLAMQHARQGEEVAAASSLDQIRKQFGGRFVPDVAGMLFIAEGVLAFYKGNSDAAFDRMRRGYGIATSMNATRARGVAAAWMAHLAFNENRYAEMVRLLKEAIECTPDSDDGVVSRYSLVLADAFHFAGSFDLARPWYQRTRLCATAEGDEATLSALLHNIAAFRASNLRLGTAGLIDPHLARHALMEAQSAYNFDVGVGTQSFGGLLPLLQAQLHSMNQQFDAAAALLEQMDESVLPSRLQAQYWAERALCCAVSVKTSEASEFANQASAGIATTRDADDRAFVHSRVAEVHRMLGHNDAAEEHRALAAYEVGRHRGEQSALLDLLSAEFVSPP